MKIKSRKALILLLPLLMTACQSYKKVPYLQEIDGVNKDTVQVLYDARIMPKDLLSITVSTTDPDVAVPFNLTVPTAVSTQQKSLTTQPVLQQYLVDNKGSIDFPVLGELHVSGLTKGEAELMVKEKLQPYIKEVPIVTVRMTNYKISVIGEVARPNTFTIANEKVNVFEALAMAGDMTVYGLRDNVKIIRENIKGGQDIITLNMNDANVIHSPYYHLQQNDVVYVTPNKTKARTSDISASTTIWFSIVGTVVSLASLIVTILR